MTWDKTPELENKILEMLENGMSLVKICQEPGIPSRSVVLKWQREDDEFSAKCARAREAQGEFMAEKLEEINEKVESGKLDPQSAKVISSNLQWTASKLASKKYGDKQQIELNANHRFSHLTDEQLEAELERKAREAGVSVLAGGKGEKEA